MIDLDRLYLDLIRPGLAACFATVTPAPLVLNYEPTSVQRPLIYSLLESRTVGSMNQIMPITYRTFHRVCVPYQDPAGAEDLTLQWLDAMPNSVWASREFAALAGVEALINVADGRAGGIVQMSEGTLGFVEIGGAKCRAIDFYSTVLVKINASLIRSLQ